MPSLARRLSSLSVRAVVLLACAVLLTYVGALSLESSEPAMGQRWLSDDYDRNVYFARAEFYAKGLRPYRDVFSEYPTVATLAFAAPYLLPGGSALTRDAYRFRWACLMAAVFALTVAIVATCRQRQGLSAAPALLLLGPSALYFGLMRFDILCACLVCLSLAAFTRGRYALAHLVLGVATFVKWYPAVIFPVYLAFHFTQDSSLTRFLRERQIGALLRAHAVRYAAAYGLTVLTILGLTVAYVTWDGFLVPYRFHNDRGAQYFNPYWMVEQHRTSLGLDEAAAWTWVNRLFFALELSIVPMLLFVRVRSVTDVFRFSVLAIYLFVTFARVDSPQWILWYLPPILMFARNRSTLMAACVLTIVNYAVFPVLFDRGFEKPMFVTVVVIKDLLLLALVVFTLRDRAD